MFIVRHKDTQSDGTAPAIQYGYGGFTISIDPFFSPAMLTMLKKYGAVLAVPNIRGGGEFGEAWHQGGIRERKVNVFDDFIAATEYLVKHKYAAPGKVAINGGSNGGPFSGLLVAACVNRAPEGTFGAAVAEVGVLDLLKVRRGHRTMAIQATPTTLTSYTLFPRYTTFIRLISFAIDDDRVVPLHSFKHAATLQHMKPNNPHPLLIRIDKKAGHGSGKSTDQRIKEAADKWASWSNLTVGLPSRQKLRKSSARQVIGLTLCLVEISFGLCNGRHYGQSNGTGTPGDSEGKLWQPRPKTQNELGSFLFLAPPISACLSFPATIMSSADAAAEREFHLTWMQEAMNMAEEALQAGEVPVGCVLYAIAKLLRRPETGPTSFATRHAELEAIDSILSDPALTPPGTRMHYPLSETTLYVTMGIKQVFFGCENDRFGGCGSVLGVNSQYEAINVKVLPHPTHSSYAAISGYMREEAILILRRFYITENSNGDTSLCLHLLSVIDSDAAPMPKSKANRVLKTEIKPAALKP
ncbi:prolyl oligopeptidase [Salix suchowensis]|nr:prolyl oligopeptidase [Salix suchowensis]